MKDYLRQILSDIDNPILANCLAREYLQARILQSLQDRGAFSAWVFQGGTALRFLYSMPRFSEDLDFALIEPGQSAHFRDNMVTVSNVFEAEDYDVNLRMNDKRTVKSAFVNFKGLPFELGLSAHSSETLSIKVEVDSNPPMGAKTTSTIVRRHVILNLQHHDKASLLAGKLHAFLARKYVKGRDIYDLIWYLSDRSWPAPNLELLNNALIQTRWTGPQVTAENCRRLVIRRVEKLDFKQVVADVEPFLERSADISLLTRENLTLLLKR
ncbi:MAG: nucleotidyl transferase AbiEii/AbiGii toxin family protein [Sedimentisphaerales bacterium]|nr:nucleotidyl transferase AbiEii/AbiGii toxin family protein [Sedimentisphaerales bacterium]